MSQLRKDSLSFPEALGQSVASAAPSFTPSLGVGVVVGMAGLSAWFVYGIAMLALTVVSVNIATLAKRIPSAGSFFIYASRTLGPSWGMMIGWAMVWSYLMTSIGTIVATSILMKSLLGVLNIRAVPPNLFTYFLMALLLWLFAFRDIRLSSRLGLVLEALSMTIIMTVCIVTWSRLGFRTDFLQLRLHGVTFSGTAAAVLFALYSYSGFESAATLGREVRKPEVAIPRAIVLTPAITGIFMMITTYIICLAFGDNAVKLASSQAPLAELAIRLNRWLAVAVYFGAMISTFACALASLNSSSRMLFSMGRYNFVHRSMGRAHDSHRTPHIAVTVGTIINLLVLTLMLRISETDLLGYIGLSASFGFVVTYLACSVAAPVYLRLQGVSSVGTIILGTIGSILMLVVLIGSVYPVPVYPYNVLIYVFIAYMATGAAWFVLLKRRVPTALRDIEKDLESYAYRKPYPR